MGRVRSRCFALAGAWCALMTAAPAAAADNVVPPQIERTGRTVTTNTGEWVPDPPGYRYAWSRCASALITSCTQIPGATARTYVLRTGDIGRLIRSRVSDSSGGDPTYSANQVGPIGAAPPKNTAAPRVSGSTVSGSTLRAAAGSWSGRMPGDPGYTYAWQRCSSAAVSSCATIAGATRASHTLGAADLGRRIRVVVGAEGLGRAQAASARVGPVTAAPIAFKRLSPFPVLVITGRLRGRVTHITDFVIRGPRRARVSVRCRGGRCPFRLVRGIIGKRKRLRIRRAQRRFRAGQVLEVRVTGRNRVGKFTRLKFRRGHAPRGSDLCLRPGAKTPRPCSQI